MSNVCYELDKKQMSGKNEEWVSMKKSSIIFWNSEAIEKKKTK